MLKWPNDLLLRGKKLSGILLERAGGRVVVGYGVNLASAPDVPGRLVAALSGRLTPHAFAPLLAASFARLLELWRSSAPALVAQAWLSRAHPIGTPLTVHADNEQRLKGNFEGLEADGALRLRLADGRLQVVRAGDVEL